MGIDPEKIVVVGIMPCTAKKFETKRDDQSASGYPDVDIALTTRELARMIESAGIYFKHLPDEEFDNPLGEGTGAVASLPLWDMALADYDNCYSFTEGGIAPYTPQC